MNFLVFLLIFSTFSVCSGVPVVCYYVLNEPPVEKVPTDLCTHVILINSLHLTENGKLEIVKKDWREFKKLRKIAPEVKLLVSLTSSNPSFSKLTSNHALMHTVSHDILFELIKHDFAGVDIDWEFPYWSRDAKKEDWANFGTFLKILKTQLTASFQLSVAVSGPPTISRKAYDVQALARYADMVQIMNYDFHVYNRFSNPLVGFNAPLHPMRAEISVLGEMNVESSMKTWHDLGLPSNISYFGIPTYVRAFQLLTHFLHKPYSPAIGSRTDYSKYSDVCQLVKHSYYTEVWNHNALAPYLYGRDGLWASYENERSILAKMAFARAQKVGGVMVFSIGSDDVDGICGDGSFPLLRLIKKLANLF